MYKSPINNPINEPSAGQRTVTPNTYESALNDWFQHDLSKGLSKKERKRRQKERKRLRKLKKRLKKKNQQLKECSALLATYKKTSWVQKVLPTILCKAVDLVVGLIGGKYRRRNDEIIVPKNGYRVFDASEVARMLVADKHMKQ